MNPWYWLNLTIGFFWIMPSFSIFGYWKKFKKKINHVLNTFENIMENGAFAPKLFHNIFKCMIFQRHHKVALWSNGLANTRSTQPTKYTVFLCRGMCTYYGEYIMLFIVIEPAERDKHDLILQQSSTQRVFWVGGGWGVCVWGGGVEI